MRLHPSTRLALGPAEGEADEPALAHTDWLRHDVFVTGPPAEIAAVQAAAADDDNASLRGLPSQLQRSARIPLFNPANRTRGTE
jgi:hypothetical protein